MRQLKVVLVQNGSNLLMGQLKVMLVGRVITTDRTDVIGWNSSRVVPNETDVVSDGRMMMMMMMAKKKKKKKKKKKMMMMVIVKKKMMMTIADLQITQYKSCSRRCNVVKDTQQQNENAR